jgi:hypothetical protein
MRPLTVATTLVVLSSLGLGCAADDASPAADSTSTGSTGDDTSASASMSATTDAMTTAMTTAMTSDPTTTSGETSGDPSVGSSGPADTSSGSTDPDTGTSSDTGASGFSVSGEVTRSALAVISLGDDGIGTLYVGALEACDQSAASAGGAMVEMADLSAVDTPVAYSIDGLPNGTYYITGFLDDDENADPRMVDADMGDLAFAQGFSPGCVEVVVDNADVTGVDFALNINLPF